MENVPKNSDSVTPEADHTPEAEHTPAGGSKDSTGSGALSSDTLQESCLSIETAMRKKTNSPTMGFSLTFCSSAFLVTSRALFKYLAETYDPNLINFLGFVVSICTCVPLMFIFVTRSDIDYAWQYNTKLLIQGSFGSLAQITGRLAIHGLPIGTVMMIFYSRLILVMIIAYYVLDEKITIVRSGLAIFAMFGILLDVRPNFIFHMNYNSNGGPWYYYALAFSQSAFVSFYFVFLRYLREIKFAIPLTVRATFGLIFSGIALSLVENWQLPNTFLSILFVILIGTLLTIGGAFLILAHKYLDAGPVSLTQSSFELLMSFVAQIGFFHHYPHWLSYVGMCFVICSLVGLGILEIQAKRKQEFIATQKRGISISSRSR